MAKKAVSVFVIIAMITVMALAPLAQPAGAFAGTIVIGAVIAVLAVSGITFAATMSSQQLQTYVSGKLDEWAASLGEPLDHLINSAGIGMTISGLMTVGTAAAQGINDFVSWLKTNLGLNNNSTLQVQSAQTSLGGYPMILSPYTYEQAGKELTGIKTGYCLFYYMENSGTYAQVAIWNSSDAPPTNCTFRMNLYWDANEYFSWITLQDGARKYYAINYIDGATRAINPNYLYHVTPMELLDDGVVTVSGGITVETGTISVIPVGENDKYFLDVGALPGDTVGVAAQNIIADAASGTLTVEGEVAESQPDYVIEGPVAVSGLDDVFPFCIPFDIYHFLQALAAEPVAPVINWRFYVPGICDETITLDFSAFETAAVILRTMELMAFCVGLAFVTRKLIRG